MASAKEDCEAVMNAFVPFAQQMLSQHGEFLPFGGAMTPGGETVAVAGYDGNERPPSMDVIRQLKRAFVAAAKQGQYMATALIYDVRVVVPKSGQKSDAIAVALDHRDDYSVVVYIPYTLEAGEPAYGEVFGQKGENDIFRRRGWRFWPARS